MKLKPIQTEIAVHTPTEEAANELLAILHENGYKWHSGDSLIEKNYWSGYKGETVYEINPNMRVNHCFYNYFVEEGLQPLSLDEFKRIMETKDDTKGLNLCELLQGHEGETFYSPICGTEIELKKNFSLFLSFHLDEENGCTIECNTKGNQNIGTLNKVGQFQTITYPHGSCMVYPTKALYEQYPLDAAKAWSVWQSEQKKHWVAVTAWIDDIECESDTAINADKIFFHTTADRDKCIEVIGAFLSRIQQSKSVASLCEEIKAIIGKIQ